ncbi:MAG: hypothetical protein ABSE62_09605 [Chthoniobacteraceae bacterium]|jgi:hypothetical protein
MRRPLPSFLIEPLESRIAPAIVLGAETTLANPLLYSSKTAINPKTGVPYLQFISTANPSSLTGANKVIAEEIGSNPDTYFIVVSASEIVEIPTSTGYNALVNVTGGSVVAVFTDLNNDGVVNSNELTGLALGNKVSVAIGTAVNGDIVTNYNDFPTKTATFALGGSAGLASDNALLANTVTSLSIVGNVTGAIVLGASTSRISDLPGYVNEILSGTAASGYTFSFEQATNASHITLAVPAPAPGVPGPSISNVIVGGASMIALGAGGPGAAGGSVHGLTVLDTLLQNSTGVTGGITVLAGAGGAGGGVKTSGGAGGSISDVLFNAPPAAIPLVAGVANPLITLTGGAGGAGSARGGAGGAVTSVYLDYNSASTGNPAAANIQDDVVIQGGDGGNGGTAGAGGHLNNINLITSTYNPTYDPTTGLTPPQLELIGGTGGNSTTGGRGGAGGGVANSQILNYAYPPPDTNTTAQFPDDTGSQSDPFYPYNTATDVLALVEGGAGGTAAVKGAGGAGGAIGTLTLNGFNFDVVAGAGGNGISSGGAGGGVGFVTVEGSAGSLPGNDYHVQTLYVATGSGGNGAAGKGGAGGTMNFLTVANADFGFQNPTAAQPYDPANPTAGSYGATAGFQLVSGTGGTAGKGAGGAGGVIENVKVLNDTDFLTDLHPLGISGSINIATGNGGDAKVLGGKGGAGGALNNVTVTGTRLEAPNISTGSGGAGGVNAAAGKGGAGGNMSGVAIRTAEGLYASTVSDSTGYLEDTTQTFTSGMVGDTVTDSLTGAQTTVEALDSPTQLELTDNVISAGDPYTITNAGVQVLASTAMDPDIDSSTPQNDTLVDATANFSPSLVGQVVENITATEANNNVPVLAVVTQWVSSTELLVSNDIFQMIAPTATPPLGDQYEFTGLATVNFSAGNGGAGAVTGAGGAGGSISDSNALAPGAVSFNGGIGGAGGPGGAAVAGGSLNGDGAGSSFASVLMQAGNAGSAGGKAGAGGSITGGSIQALTSITLIAGNGASGGAGGNVNSVGYSQNIGTFTAPSGNITVQAGSGGSTATGHGGAGGGISRLTGFVNSGQDPFATPYDVLVGTGGFLPDFSETPLNAGGVTQFVAGAGGGGLAKAGAGGSVDDVRFFGGGGPGVTFFINAGDAGNATAGTTGAAGGSVSNIGGGAFASGTANTNFSLSTFTDFHHISAGNGGSATKKGGVGGSVNDVYVNAAIGLRTGAMFGFDIDGVSQYGGAPTAVTGAGGISAGAGGAGTIAGAAGGVSNIAADAIASIVAGHMHVGQELLEGNLVAKVNNIILNGQGQNDAVITPAAALVQDFELTYNGQTTGPIASNATVTEVASALNGLTNMPAGGVTVNIAPGGNGFVVTFEADGAQPAITGSIPFVTTDGTTAELVAGSGATHEQQTVQVTQGPFFLSFNGVNSPQIPANATPAQVAAILNSVTTITAVGGVTVTTSAGNNNTGYDIIFNTLGFKQLISNPMYAQYSMEQVAGNATTQETQQVQVLVNDPFTLTFDGQTTAQLPANASATQVQSALDSLSNVSTAGSVTVTSTTAASGNPAYQITFGNDGAEQLIIPNLSMNIAQTTLGNGTTESVQTITLPTVGGEFNPVQFATASLVGSIYNILQPNAAVFNFTPSGGSFQFGDAPVDGLIAAVNLTSAKNFVPEAFVTADAAGNAVLIDNVNS